MGLCFAWQVDSIRRAGLRTKTATHAVERTDLNLVMTVVQLTTPGYCRTTQVHTGLTANTGFGSYLKGFTLDLDWV